MTVHIIPAQPGLLVFYYGFAKGVTASSDWKEVFDHEVFSVISWRIEDAGSDISTQFPLSLAQFDYSGADSFALILPDGHVESRNPACAERFPTFEVFYKNLLKQRKKRDGAA